MHHSYMEFEARDRQKALLREVRERRLARAIKSARRDGVTSPRSLLRRLLWVSWRKEEHWTRVAAEKGSDLCYSVTSTERS